LVTDDFRQNEGSNASEVWRDERKITERVGTINITSSYIDEAGRERQFSPRYSLGTDFKGKTLVKLSENLYGIVEKTQGFQRLTHIFEPATSEQIRNKIEEFKTKKGKEPESADIYFGKRDKDTPKPVPFNEAKLSPKREDETPEEYAQRVAAFNAAREYGKLHKISQDLSEQANIGIHNLSFQEQNALATFALESDENYKRVIIFGKKFGNKGIKTFLACEYGQEIGNSILDLADKLEPELAEKIFIKYSEIVDAAKDAVDYCREFFSAETGDNQAIVKQIGENLLSRGKNLLLEFHLLAKKSPQTEKILDQLDAVKADIMLFASTFQAVANNSQERLRFNEIAKVKMESKSAEQLMPGEKEEMIRIFLSNREKNYSKKLTETLVNDFIRAMETSGSTFYLLTYQGKVVSFMRIEKTGEKRVYAGSFNVRPEARGSKIGTVMMQEIIDELAKENVIEAVAYSQKPDLLEFYKQKFGFKQVGEIPDYLGTGELFYKIERDDRLKTRGAASLAA